MKTRSGKTYVIPSPRPLVKKDTAAPTVAKTEKIIKRHGQAATLFEINGKTYIRFQTNDTWNAKKKANGDWTFTTWAGKWNGERIDSSIAYPYGDYSKSDPWIEQIMKSAKRATKNINKTAPVFREYMKELIVRGIPGFYPEDLREFLEIALIILERPLPDDNEWENGIIGRVASTLELLQRYT